MANSDGPKLHKAVSDLSTEFSIYNDMTEIDQVLRVSCECCGLEEDCTKPYILKVMDSHSGNWICGLCSEAVKENLAKLSPRSAIKEALRSHMEFCRRYNSTTRVNPKLSLTCTMKEIAKKSWERRNSGHPPLPCKILRSSSCVSRIDH
ncbi:hypothetical protein SAY87_006711 [Trapa incisa]|uniref:DUF1677 family protein n=2 Tax=Trapa TaxID=22665 RepID=A0AAN7L462_TRANT|nr:hypothetical protein SAY87_006711 [Trapa incisa]KAK4774336.1 hypothetical protein SAY86_009271 [Trapa natans]